MGFYNIYIHQLFKDTFVIALDQNQIDRAVTSYLEGESSVKINGVTYDITQASSFCIYTISPDPAFGSKEDIEWNLRKYLRVDGLKNFTEEFLKKFGVNITDELTHGLGWGEGKTQIKNAKPLLSEKKMGKIFISHATKNHKIITQFCDLILNNALNINLSKEVFNTSLEGSKPKTGEDFRVSIKEELFNAKVVLQFISKEYKESEVCLNEMGAAWVLSNKVIPIIINRDEYEVGFIHSTTQQCQLHDKQSILNLIDDLKEGGIIGDFISSRLNKKVDEFLEWLNKQEQIDKDEIIIGKGLSNLDKFESDLMFIGDPITKVSTDPIFNTKTGNFFKVNEHRTIYFVMDNKLCPIPDDYTRYFLGYNHSTKTNKIFISELSIKGHIGKPIKSILNEQILYNEQEKSLWLIINDMKHHINQFTYDLLLKANKEFKTRVVSADHLNELMEGNEFDLKGTTA